MEEIGIQTKDRIEFIQKEKLFFRLIATRANRFSHDRPVLLFNIAVVVFFRRSRSGEGDLFGLTILEELVIDEFSTII